MTTCWDNEIRWYQCWFVASCSYVEAKGLKRQSKQNWHNTSCRWGKYSAPIASKHEKTSCGAKWRKLLCFVLEWTCLIDDDDSLHSVFLLSWNMSKCVYDRTRSWFWSQWGNSSWWPARPISLCFREFLGQRVLRCCVWEPPTFHSFLMMCGVTAVHSAHCKSITWDVNADEWHTHSKRRWKCQSSSLLSYFLITLCHSHWTGGHFEDALKM